jgi:hypothetical protein
MTQFTDKLHATGQSSNERVVDMGRDDVGIILTWYGKQKNSTPMFSELYNRSKEHFTKRVGFGSSKMVFTVMKEDIDNAVYWAELNNVEEEGETEEQEMLKYLKEVQTNAHMEKLMAKIKNKNNPPAPVTPQQDSQSNDSKCCDDSNCCTDTNCDTDSQCCSNSKDTKPTTHSCCGNEKCTKKD